MLNPPGKPVILQCILNSKLKRSHAQAFRGMGSSLRPWPPSPSPRGPASGKRPANAQSKHSIATILGTSLENQRVWSLTACNYNSKMKNTLEDSSNCQDTAGKTDEGRREIRNEHAPDVIGISSVVGRLPCLRFEIQPHRCL